MNITETNDLDPTNNLNIKKSELMSIPTYSEIKAVINSSEKKTFLKIKNRLKEKSIQNFFFFSSHLQRLLLFKGSKLLQVTNEQSLWGPSHQHYVHNRAQYELPGWLRR